MVESANFIPQFRLRVGFMRETTKREKHTHKREIQTICFRRAPGIACPLILASARVSCLLVCLSLTRDFSLYTSNLELFRLDFPASLSNPRLNCQFICFWTGKVRVRGLHSCKWCEDCLCPTAARTFQTTRSEVSKPCLFPA